MENNFIKGINEVTKFDTQWKDEFWDAVYMWETLSYIIHEKDLDYEMIKSTVNKTVDLFEHYPNDTYLLGDYVYLISIIGRAASKTVNKFGSVLIAIVADAMIEYIYELCNADKKPGRVLHLIDEESMAANDEYFYDIDKGDFSGFIEMARAYSQADD